MKQFFRWLAPSVLLMAMVMGQPALATDPAPAKKDDGHGAPAKDDHGAKKDDHGAKKDDHGAKKDDGHGAPAKDAHGGGEIGRAHV